MLGVSRSNASTPGVAPIRVRPPFEDGGVLFRLQDSSTSPYGTSSLLSLSYQYLTPFSPEHPAMKDIDFKTGRREGEGEREGEGGGEGEGERGETDEFVLPGEGEPGIRRVTMNCTAIDVMGM